MWTNGHWGAVTELSTTAKRKSAHERATKLLVPGCGALFAYAVVAQGAFYPTQAIFLATAAAALALVSARPTAISRVPLASFGLLAAGLSVSAIANGWPQQARVPYATLVAGTGVFLLASALISAGERDRMLEALSWVASLAALLGLIALAFHWYPFAMQAQKLWRTSSTLTYANAAGGLFALALPAPILLARSRPGPGPSLAVYLITAGLVTSLSRGALAGALISVLVARGLGARADARRVARPVIAALAASAAALPSIAGNARPVIALGGLLLGAGITAFPLRIRTAALRRGLAAALIAGVVLIPMGTALRHGNRVVGSRLSDDRLSHWRATWHEAMRHPIVGSGPGTFHVIEIRGRQSLFVRYAHNDFLQAFSETGAVGVATLLGAIGILAVWAFRRRPRRETGERAVWAWGVAACAAFVVHGGLDFMWRLPVLVAVGFMWLAVACVRPEQIGGNE